MYKYPNTSHSLQLQPILHGKQFDNCNRWRVSSEGTHRLSYHKNKKVQQPHMAQCEKTNHHQITPCSPLPSTLHSASDKAKVGLFRYALRRSWRTSSLLSVFFAKVWSWCAPPLSLASLIFQIIPALLLPLPLPRRLSRSSSTGGGYHLPASTLTVLTKERRVASSPVFVHPFLDRHFWASKIMSTRLSPLVCHKSRSEHSKTSSSHPT